MNMEFNATLKAITMVAYEMGPFFFSILFLLVIVRWAHKCYVKVTTQDPKPSGDDIKCYRRLFSFSFTAGLLLAFISVGWWIYAHMERHTLQGVIVGLREDSLLLGYTGDVYLYSSKREQRNTDWHFVVVRDDPFTYGEPIKFKLFPKIGTGYEQEPEPEPIIISFNYSGKDNQIIEWNESNSKLQASK